VIPRRARACARRGPLTVPPSHSYCALFLVCTKLVIARRPFHDPAAKKRSKQRSTWQSRKFFRKIKWLLIPWETKRNVSFIRANVRYDFETFSLLPYKAVHLSNVHVKQTHLILKDLSGLPRRPLLVLLSRTSLSETVSSQ
jgi:hypothetical protein